MDENSFDKTQTHPHLLTDSENQELFRIVVEIGLRETTLDHR